MKSKEWIVIIGWFALAIYVMARAFTSTAVDYDILFAAWCGGVLSTVCVQIFRSRDKGSSVQE